VRQRNVGIVLAASGLAILIIVVAVYFGPQAVRYVRLRPLLQKSNDYPPRGWSSAPSTLEELGASTADGRVILRPGYRFEVPWNEIKSERDDGRIEFQSGQELNLGGLETSEAEPINPQILHFESSEFARLFGMQKRQSRYEQFKGIVSAVPSGLSPLQSRTEFRRYESLLEIKGLWFEHNPVAPDIWSFQTKDYRGFELSGLERGWQNVTLNFFDSDDHWFAINIQGNELGGVYITQPEINRVIQSFRAVRIGE
jgi:hypothetical protein